MASRTMLLTRKWPLKALPLHSWRPGYLLGFHLCEAPAMSFELILPFLRPIEPLLLDDSISEIMGNPDASWWYERDGIMRQEALFNRLTGGITASCVRRSLTKLQIDLRPTERI